jgi:hypothetical protein
MRLVQYFARLAVSAFGNDTCPDACRYQWWQARALAKRLRLSSLTIQKSLRIVLSDASPCEKLMSMSEISPLDGMTLHASVAPRVYMIIDTLVKLLHRGSKFTTSL